MKSYTVIWGLLSITIYKDPHETTRIRWLMAQLVFQVIFALRMAAGPGAGIPPPEVVGAALHQAKVGSRSSRVAEFGLLMFQFLGGLKRYERPSGGFELCTRKKMKLFQVVDASIFLLGATTGFCLQERKGCFFWTPKTRFI